MSFSSDIKTELAKKKRKNRDAKRALIREAFLSSGSMSDPEKAYHFEIVCQSMEEAKELQEAMAGFDLEAKIVTRKKSFVVYLKEGSQIVDILNVMEAHVALLNLENVRVVKEVRNSVNRQVNCETANIHKTVSAAVGQIEDIRFLESTVGLESLSDSLRAVAELRLEYPETPLKELGELLSPPLGKSGVNHRLKRLSELAEAVRQKNKEGVEWKKKLK